MALYQAKAFPSECGGNGWKSISSVKKSFPKLEENIKADWLIVGAGFSGIAAAQRLTELRGNDKIVLLDALEIAEGPVGRNSGFMIDVPHNIETSGSYTKEIEKDRQDIFRNRKVQYTITVFFL